VDQPDTRFVWDGEVAIAYQVVGDGAIDLLHLPGPLLSNLDLQWDHPLHARFLERLASFSRLIMVDRRGWGTSDRVTPGTFPPLETAADDLTAVLDTVGSPRAALFACSESAWVATIAAATYPDRFSALILYEASANYLRTDETPWNFTLEELEADESTWVSWGTMDFAESWSREFDPSLAGDRTAVEHVARMMRGTIGPGGGLAEYRLYCTTDVRAILPTIQVPTLVLYRPAFGLTWTEGPTWTEGSRYVASKIPGARLVELPGADYTPWAGESDALLDEIEEFLTGVRPVPESDRALATVLFTDIVESTTKAADIGDAAWKRLVAAHHERIRAELARHRGCEVDTAGDGFFATFDGPARAVRCALAATEAVRDLGVEIRAGVHTGEVELDGDAVRGIAVHIGARVAGQAGPSQVMASQTVKDLVAGSGLQFEDAGEHELKGIPDRWRLYRVVA